METPRSESLKNWSSTGVDAPLAGVYTIPAGTNGDQDRRELLAGILTTLYGVVGSAQAAPVEADKTKNAVNQLVIANSALVASEADAFLTLVSVGLEYPAQIHLRAVGEMTRRVVLCHEYPNLALALYDSAEPSWRKLASAAAVPDVVFEKGEKDMRALEQTAEFKAAKKDVTERFHLISDNVCGMWSKRSHGDIYALVQVAEALRGRNDDVRTPINQTLPPGIGVNSMLSQATAYAFSCLGMIVTVFGVQANEKVKQLWGAVEAMQARDEASGALRPPSATT
jgi:hypothetical protein